METVDQTAGQKTKCVLCVWGWGAYMCVFGGGEYGHMCGSQSLTSDVFLDHSPPYFLSSGLSLSLELNDLVTPAGHQIPRIVPLPVLAYQHENHKQMLLTQH